MQGAVCPRCAKSEATEGWSGLTDDVLGADQPHGMVSVLLSFARHPVDTIIRLTDDPTYRGHWGLLWTCLGAQLTLLFVVLPHMSAFVFGVPAKENRSAILVTEVLQYIGIAILVPIQFYLCRALGTRPRSPRLYGKFCALSVAYCSLLGVVLSLLAWALIVALVKLAIPFQPQVLQVALVGAMQLAVVAFVAMAHRRFWGMTWPRAIGVTAAIAVLSWLVVYPALITAAGKLLPATMGHLAPT